MTIRVGVFGAGGRMGALVCQAVADDPDLELVATVDPHHAGIDLRQVAKIDSPLQVAASADEFVRRDVEVAVDFTVFDAAQSNLEFLAVNGIHAVVGTTGFTDADHEHLRSIFVRSNCLVAPNFSIGSVLMTRFAEIAAPFFETASVVEMLPEEAVHVPSPAAESVTQRLTAASPSNAPAPLHAVRMRGLPGRHEVVLGTTGQWLSMVHRSSGDSMFMPGVLLAVKNICRLPGLTVGLDDLLIP